MILNPIAAFYGHLFGNRNMREVKKAKSSNISYKELFRGLEPNDYILKK